MIVVVEETFIDVDDHDFMNYTFSETYTIVIDVVNSTR